MDIKINRISDVKTEPLIEQDDLVRGELWGESYYGVVIKDETEKYNVVVFELEQDEYGTEQFNLEWDFNVSYEELIKNFELAAKSKDYEVIINYKG